MVMAPTVLQQTSSRGSTGRSTRRTRDPQVRELAPKLGFELDPNGAGTPEAAEEFLKDQLALWARTTQELGIEPQ